MIGLGSSIAKPGKIGKRIVRDGLVLKHDYSAGAVEPCSTGAASFNGTSDYIQLPDPFSYSKITVSAWIYLSEETTIASVIYESRDSGDDGFLFYVDTSEAIRIKAQGTSVAGTAGLPLNNWVHACFTYDSSAGSSNIKLYENGVLVNTGNETDSVAITANAKLGGGVSTVSGYWFPGYICNAGVWDEVLTQAQVKSIMHKDYTSLSASEKTNLVSWWNLDSVIDSVGASTAVYDNHYAGGSELGSELVTNGTFDSNLTNWGTNGTDSNNTIVQANGKVVLTSDGSTPLLLQQTSVFEIGKIYKVQFDAYDITGAGFKIQSGSDEDISAITADGSYTVYHKATGTNVNIFRRTGDSASAGKLDNISVKLVNGNHGTLA